MLREAAKSAETPQEAVAMLEAADYVELPSAINVLQMNKKAPQQESSPKLETRMHPLGK